MPFDCPSHRDAMQAFPNYVTNTSFLSNIRWGQEGYSHMLKNKIDKDDAVAIVVGKVIDDRLSCGPTGNWSTGNVYGSLKGAKFCFALGQPDEEVFAKEFDIAFKTLGKLQSYIASTPNRLHFVMGKSEKFQTLRFATNIFEERETVSEPL